MLNYTKEVFLRLAEATSESPSAIEQDGDSEVASAEMDDVPLLGDIDSEDSIDPYGAGTGEEASEYSDD